MQSKHQMQSSKIPHNLSDILSRSKLYHPREVMVCLQWEPRIVQRQMRHNIVSISYTLLYLACCSKTQTLHWQYEVVQMSSKSSECWSGKNSFYLNVNTFTRGKLLCINNHKLHFTYEGE
ncbi:hypothetical protein EUGRSUZ_H03787 [Eucalyptus grandis]|uniref:Uncharacterized protein n=2 Tax=Eucalyptus grandis TaxID=71139 RepID=A0ACC3JU91_EUCGR|nr:hypothetical protein EUGRSUZ_H03787 [Eucalyptus grandis]